MESPPIDESTSASTVSSPPDPNTPPQQLYNYQDDPEDRKVFDRVQSPVFHHQELTILPPIHAPRVKSELPPQESSSYPYLDVPAFTYEPSQINDRIPPLERASIDGGFWPAVPVNAPIRRSSFLAELYAPQDSPVEVSSLEPSPAQRDSALPPIQHNHHYTTNSNPQQQQQQQQQWSDHLPPISTPAQTPPAPNYYATSTEQPPYYRRASYPISRDDSLPAPQPVSYLDQQQQNLNYGSIRQAYPDPAPQSAPPVQQQPPNYPPTPTYQYPPRQDSALAPLQYQNHHYPQPSYPHSYSQQQPQQAPCLPRPSHSLPSSSSWGYGGQPIMHTDDAASKETAHLRRRCFNCHTTEPPSWRRSTLNPGKIVCNRCGLYERTHLRPRPSGIGGELRKAPPKLTHTQGMIGNTAPYTLAPMVSKANRAKTLNVAMQPVQEYGTAH